MDSAPILPLAPRPPAPTRQLRLAKAQAQDVIEAYEAGTTMAALAKEYGVKRQTISDLLRRSGVAIRPRRVITQGELDQAERLYGGGLSVDRIAKRLGWDQATIYRQLKKRGVVMRGPNDWQRHDP